MIGERGLVPTPEFGRPMILHISYRHQVETRAHQLTRDKEVGAAEMGDTGYPPWCFVYSMCECLGEDRLLLAGVP